MIENSDNLNVGGNNMNALSSFYLNHKKPLKYALKIGVTLGKNVSLTSGINWGSEPYLISVGDNTRISQNVTFVCHDGGVHVLRNCKQIPEIDLIKPISIGSNCFIGINSTILPGSIIENNVIVGACSLVVGTLEKNSVYAGVPAKRICSIDEYFDKHKNDFLLTKMLNKKEKKDFLIKTFKQ